MSRKITWVGHATVVLELGDARFITDPVLRDRVLHLLRRTATPADPGPVDGVLISHLHYDHLDRPSLRRLEGAVAVAPVGAKKLLKSFDVHEVHVGDTVEIAGVTIEAVPAWHDGRRRPGPGGLDLDALGFLTEGIWFAGDTDLDPAMEELRGRVDVALIPIWGWGPSLGPGHIDPAGAAKVVELVRPRIAIPIHWGTFLPIGLGKRHARVLSQPPLVFAALASKLTRVETIAPGGSLDV